MKKKLVAILLLVAIFAGFAGQVYAVSMNGQIVEEEPNGPIREYIIYYESSSNALGNPHYITVEEYGHLYSGNMFWIKTEDGVNYYSGVLYLQPSF